MHQHYGRVIFYDIVYYVLYVEDMRHLQSYLEEITGVTTNLIRFPGGSSNHVSNVDMRELIRYLNEEGFTYFDWNVASGDATSQVYKCAGKELSLLPLHFLSQKMWL